LTLEGVTSRAAQVHDVSFAVRRGEIVGLAGLVGAGRTELARVLFGLEPLDAGTIQLAGQTIRPRSPADAIARGLAYLPEDRRRHGVILDLGVDANLTLAALKAISKGVFLDHGAETAIAGGLVQKLGIKTPALTTPVRNLSGGNQQKVALGRWLVRPPTVLILDEPTQGVDVGAKSEIHRLIGELAAQGMAVLMISSELVEVLGMSDRIVVMRHGRVAAVIARADATAESVMAAAFGTASAA